MLLLEATLFINNIRLKLAKNPAKAKQQPVADICCLKLFAFFICLVTQTLRLSWKGAAYKKSVYSLKNSVSVRKKVSTYAIHRFSFCFICALTFFFIINFYTIDFEYIELFLRIFFLFMNASVASTSEL